jgi:hypothetical protein
LLVAAAACGGKNGGAAQETGTESGDGDGDGESTETGEPWEPIPARGVRIDYVEANQGIAVPVAVDGVWVGPTERNSALHRTRALLLRGTWDVDDAWEPREIECRLTIESSLHEEPLVLSQVKMLESDSYFGDLNRNFFWLIPPEEVVPGMTFRMELWETGPGAEDLPEPDPPPTAPIDGPALIGIEDVPMEFRPTLVPVEYSFGECDTVAVPNEEQSAGFVRNLFEKNSLQVVHYTLHEEHIVRTTELTSLAQFFTPLQQMRTADGADPNEYYFALVDACSGGVDGAGGIAPSSDVPATKAASLYRVSVGLWLPGNVDFSYETFVHELGHNQSLAHVFCPGGNAAGPDPNYPYEDGKTGVWGFAIESFQIKNPTANYDYMSYCNPTWPSDWTWNKTGGHIRTLTSWDYEAPEPEPTPVAGDFEGEMLVGLLLKDGRAEWWTTRGGLLAHEVTPGQEIVYRAGAREIARVGAKVELLEDGNTMVFAPLPEDLGVVTSIVRNGPDVRQRVDPGQVIRQPETMAAWKALWQRSR